MIEKIYVKDYIITYEKFNNYLNTLLKKNKSKFIKDFPIGITSFGYTIDHYKIGNGKNHVIVLGATHGTEIITSYFVLEMISTLLEDTTLYLNLSKNFTFHFIPILNPEGYIISTSCLPFNFKDYSINEIEKISSKYLKKYNIDDNLASKNMKVPKLHREVLKASTSFINNTALQKEVDIILKKCKLGGNVTPTWSANGKGIDINSNSIHKFKEITALRKSQKFAPLRYNDIPVTNPSPMSYPGFSTFEKRCPENLALYKFIDTLFNYNLNYSVKDKLVAIFSYHATGGQIYGFPDNKYSSLSQISLHLNSMNVYSKYTGYSKINETLKYGIMDFYRIVLDDVLCLTIELSKKNGNPIGPLSNIEDFNKDIINNKLAIFKTIENLI
ncbi:MAG: M14 family zinc carboxypeptidase [Clostridia bacterium]